MSTNLYCAECKAELIQENFTLVCLRCDRKDQTLRMDSICPHVYRNIGQKICPDCNKPTHEIDWVEQRRLEKQWRKENPNPQYGGWWSI